MRWISRFLTGTVVCAALMLLGSATASAQDICYQGHIQDWGWVPPVCDGAMLGSVGQSRRLEAFMVRRPTTGGDVCYQAHVAGVGWSAIRCNGVDIHQHSVGTTGQKKAIEAFVLFHNNPPFGHQLKYRGHLGGFGWQGPVDSGFPIGNTGQRLRVEAMEVHILRPGEPTPFWQ